MSKHRITYHKQGKRAYFLRSEVEEWMLRNRIASDDEIESKAETYCALKRDERTRA